MLQMYGYISHTFEIDEADFPDQRRTIILFSNAYNLRNTEWLMDPITRSRPCMCVCRGGGGGGRSDPINMIVCVS